MIKNKKKKIKYDNQLFTIRVYPYGNSRMCLILENNITSYEITVDVPDMKLSDGYILLNPDIDNFDRIVLLKKLKIIKEIKCFVSHDYTEFPVAILNMGKLREYDYLGVISYIENNKNEVSSYE